MIRIFFVSLRKNLRENVFNSPFLTPIHKGCFSANICKARQCDLSNRDKQFSMQCCLWFITVFKNLKPAQHPSSGLLSGLLNQYFIYFFTITILYSQTDRRTSWLYSTFYKKELRLDMCLLVIILCNKMRTNNYWKLQIFSMKTLNCFQSKNDS